MNKSVSILAVVVALTLGAGCQGGGQTQNQSALVLDLQGSGLLSVPSWVFEVTTLEELNLADNQLTGALPAEIRHLSRLRILDASGNAMTGVPAEVGQLSSLEVLDLSDNQLTGLPLELGNLQNLQTLDLRSNAISEQDLTTIRAKLTQAEIIE